METFEKYINWFVCPACGCDLKLVADQVECASGGHLFSYDRGIPLLFWPNRWEGAASDVTEIVKSFYEATPFPNYEGLDSSESLREKARRGMFARLLDEQIRHGAKVIEIGCGTGQLSNFLGVTWGRTVFGTDLCLNSLKLAQRFKEQNRIGNVVFLQMNLFRPVFRPGTFDLVICNGVLHHTSDPFLGFQTISRLVKPNGFIVIGLYNRYGRISTDVRRVLFRATGDRFKFLDRHLADKSVDKLKRHTWFMDQYKNPHESKHTYGEVLSWFDAAGFEFINSIPKMSPGASFSAEEKLFRANPRGGKFERFLVQLGLLVSAGGEGGFFTMIGRRPSAGTDDPSALSRLGCTAIGSDSVATGDSGLSGWRRERDEATQQNG